MSSPSSGLKNKLPANQEASSSVMLVFYLANSSTLMMEATCSTKMLVDF
jgi:hypothetical protein